MVKYGYHPDDNYCTLSPDTLFGVRFNYACYLHDRQYRNEVKKRKTRKQTDIDLRDRIYSDYLKHNKKLIGYLVSRFYYFSARLIGLKTWVN